MWTEAGFAENTDAVYEGDGKGRRDIDDELEQRDVRACFINRTTINTVCNDRRVSGGDLAAPSPGRPENVACLPGHRLGSRRTDQESCDVHCGKA